MKTGWKALMVVVAVLVILSSLVMAQPMKGEAGKGVAPGEPGMKPGPKGPGHPGGLIPVLAWWLDLTKEQVEQMQAVVEAAQPDAGAAADAVADAHEALQEAVTGGASEEEIRAAAMALGTVIGNQAVLHAQTLASIKAVLTEEQLQEFERVKTKLLQLSQLMQNAKLQGGSDVKPREPQDKTGKTPAGKGDTGDKRPADNGTTALVKIFKAADTNKDGVLTMEELQAFLATMKGGQPTVKK